MDEAVFQPVGTGERLGLAMLLRWFAASLQANPGSTLLAFSAEVGDDAGVGIAMWLPVEDDPALMLAEAIGSPTLDAMQAAIDETLRIADDYEGDFSAVETVVAPLRRLRRGGGR